MKTIFFAIALLTILHQLSFAEVTLSGPTQVCPGIQYTYSANGHWPFGTAGCFQFIFYSDGVIVGASTPLDCDCSRDESTDSEPFIWPSLTSNALVEVRFIPRNWPGCDYYVDVLPVVVGLATPSIIAGDINICPGATSTYNTGSDPDADSYTWEVPYGWSVNGISGPVVTGQTNIVSLTAASSGAGFATMKVKKNSSYCGESAYKTRLIELDYTPTVYSSTTCSSNPEFSAMSAGAVSYYWEVPSNWYLPGDPTTPMIIAYNYGNPGFVVCYTETICGNTTQGYVAYDVWGCGLSLGADQNRLAFPNPMTDELVLRNENGLPISNIYLVDEQNETVKKVDGLKKKITVDTSDLKPGTYYLKYQKGNQNMTERLIKE